MPTTRSYADACGIARALDVVGERWALLVVRELLLGPQRFSDLRQALPGASSNLVADRLRELEARGVVQRRTLPPPAASRVYELTEWGTELEPIVLALGGWGLRVPLPDTPTTLSATSVLLYLRGSVYPDPGVPAETFHIQLGDRVWTIRTTAGELHIHQGGANEPTAFLRTNPQTLNAMIGNPQLLDKALATGTAVVTGDLVALRRLLDPARPHPDRRPPSQIGGGSRAAQPQPKLPR